MSADGKHDAEWACGFWRAMLHFARASQLGKLDVLSGKLVEGRTVCLRLGWGEELTFNRVSSDLLQWFEEAEMLAQT